MNYVNAKKKLSMVIVKKSDLKCTRRFTESVDPVYYDIKPLSLIKTTWEKKTKKRLIDKNDFKGYIVAVCTRMCMCLALI